MSFVVRKKEYIITALSHLSQSLSDIVRDPSVGWSLFSTCIFTPFGMLIVLWKREYIGW